MFDESSLSLVFEKTEEAIQRKIKDFRNGYIFRETDFTSSLLSSLRDDLNGLILKYRVSPDLGLGSTHFTDNSYRLNARVVDSNVQESEEFLSGADILIGYSGPYNGAKINKAALIQAKIYTEHLWDKFSGFPPGKTRREELFSQCKRMERITHHQSYVVIYSGLGIKFYRSEYILKRCKDFGLNFDDGHDFSYFIRDLFECKIGDKNFGYLAYGNLKTKLKEMGIRHGFMTELDPV